jgi:hypothetical protein
MNRLISREATIQIIYTFLDEIGIGHSENDIEQSTFLPGILIAGSHLIIDSKKLLYPGDLLHEAGHIAVRKAEERAELSDNVMDGKTDNESDEIAVLLWSYFACKHCQLPLETVFHPDGYKNDSNWLIKQFESKQYLGLPLLLWMGIAVENDLGEPEIKQWLRD